MRKLSQDTAPRRWQILRRLPRLRCLEYPGFSSNVFDTYESLGKARRIFLRETIIFLATVPSRIKDKARLKIVGYYFSSVLVLLEKLFLNGPCENRETGSVSSFHVLRMKHLPMSDNCGIILECLLDVGFFEI